MKYLIFNTFTEKYYFSNTIPADKENLDIIDLEAKKCLFGPSAPHDLEEYVDPDAEVETQEIPRKEEREYDPEEKLDTKIEN